MTTTLQENSDCTEHLLLVPANRSKPRKQWRSVFITISCSRIFPSLVNKSPKPKEKTKPIPRAPSFVSLTVAPEINNHFRIDQTTLVELMKDKNIERLQTHGGVGGVASALGTDTKVGISGGAEDIACRHEAFGFNTNKKRPKKSFFHFVAEEFKDVNIMILLLCSALSLGFGIKKQGPKEGWYDGGSIIAAVFLVTAVSAISNYRQNKKFDKLSEISNNIQIDVVRGGRHQQISIFDIVVGDIVRLKIGDQVPADGLFLDGHSLEVDESSMAGESNHVEVNRYQNPFLLSGTKVVDGYAQMLVTSVGMNTTWGQTMSQINRDTKEQTPLQTRLNKLKSSFSKLGLSFAFLILVVLLVRYFTGNTTDENGNQKFNRGKTKANDIINVVIRIVTIVVIAIPEGLPLAVTLTLAYSMKRMMADQAMVRKLSACETMGSVNVICTDKTGTLTLDQMKVKKFSLGKEFMEEGVNSISPFVVDLIHQGVAFNTSGSVSRASSRTEFEFLGSPTEKAILSWAVLEMNMMDMEKIKRRCAVLQVEAFNSHKKRSGVLIRRSDDDSVHVHWKGATEMILAMCSSYYDASGNVKDINNERVKFEQIIQGMAASSLRCIAFAHKQVTEEEYENLKEQKKLKEDSLTLLGLVGIKDPCRPGVKKAIEDCQYAGVNVKMITGDNVFTARAIATECGILMPGEEMFSDVVIEGEVFKNFTPHERMEKVQKIRVMARSSPFDKLLMVQCLKQKGLVIAVTGDGTNDAPALKEADIGLSMGIQGTEVAKESSDIVILDDNFASVATVLRWGRCVHNNIQKFIQFQLTANVAALCINFVAAISTISTGEGGSKRCFSNFVAVVSTGEVPLAVVQVLWVNLIMDTLGALALATERPTKELMEKLPVGQKESLVTYIMWRNLLAQALYQIAVILTLQFRGESIFGITDKVNDTLIFNTFVLCQVCNEFNAMKLEKKNVFEGIRKNKLFMGIIAITILLQVVMVEFFKRFADTERLNWGQWGVCIAIAAMSWPIDWAVKCIPVPEKSIFSYLKGRQ